MLPQLVDHLGRPIDFSVLREEVSAPTVASARDLIGGHPASGLTPPRLASILRQAEAGSPRAYFDLAEEIEEKDLHYLGVLGTRKRQVAQLQITVEAAGDDADAQADAQLIRDWLARDTLEDDLFDILDAVGKGTSVVEIIWDMSERQWWPARLEYVLPRWWEFDQVTGKEVRLLDAQGVPQPLQPWKFIVHQVKAKSGLPIRNGLARPVSWAWMFKNYTVKDWVGFAEVYGMPFRVGKYDSNASVEDRRTLLRAVADLGTDAAAIIPKSMEVEFINGAAGADGSLFQNGAEWFDRQISKAVLGQTATTDADTGGLGSGKEHGDVREDIEKADAKGLAASINLYIVRPMVDANRGPPKAGRYPRVLVGRADAWDADKMMPQVERFVKLGGRVEASVIGDRLGLPDPPADAVLLTAPKGPAEPPAGQGEGPPPLPTPGKGARSPSQASHGPSAAHAAAGSAGDPPADAIDHLIGDLLSDTDWVAAPIMAGLQGLSNEGGGLEGLRDRLAQQLSGMDVTELGEMLARSAFSARLAGLAGQQLSELEDQA